MTDKKKKLKIEARIDRYVNGQLSDNEVEDLWVELIQHEEYMDYLKTSANLKEIVHDEDINSRTPQVWAYAAAAAIILLLVVFGTLQMGYFNHSTAVDPINKIELDYYRSAEAPAKLSDNKKIIRKAIELFNKGQFQKAVSLLNAERDKASDFSWISELDITLGTLYYNKDKFNEAAFYFKDVVKYKDNDQVKDLTLEKAYWYLGNSYFQMDMLTEAEVAMKKAYKLNGAYSRVAKSYLDAMADVKKQSP